MPRNSQSNPSIPEMQIRYLDTTARKKIVQHAQHQYNMFNSKYSLIFIQRPLSGMTQFRAQGIFQAEDRISTKLTLLEEIFD